jgi:MFS transporter, CP family, cyanate transporter
VSHSAAPVGAAWSALGVALGVRPQLVLLGPIVPWLVNEFGADHATLGLIGTVALLATAAGASMAWLPVARLGPATAVGASLALIVIAGLARATAPGIAWLLAWSAVVGLAIGIVSTALLSWVHAVRMTPRIGSTVYTIGMLGGSILAGALAAPIAATSGSWRVSMVLLTGISLGSLCVWAGRPRAAGQAAMTGVGARWRRPSGFGLGLAIAFGLQAAVYQSLVLWGPDLLAEHGWPVDVAGAVVAVINLVALIMTMATFSAGRRAGRPEGQLVAATVLIVLGLVLVIVLGNPLIGITVVAMGLGIIFPALFAVALIHAADAGDAAATSGAMNSLGFAIAAIAPLALGIGRDMTGSYEAPLFELLSLALLLLLLVTRLAAARSQTAFVRA